MKFFSWQVVLGIVLIAASVLVYTVHYLIFHDSHHIFIYLVGDIAFVFIEVLMVTLILHRLLEAREKKAKLKKMNMVIGSFFSETGTELLRSLSTFDADLEKTRQSLFISDDWSGAKFSDIKKQVEKTQFSIDAQRGDLEGLRNYLSKKRENLMRILENPNILEHESFTDVLWAVSHLGAELEHRENLGCLSEKDYEHFAGDIDRAYSRLIGEWLAYMKHLKEDYPYLFSLAHRLNPFDPHAAAEIS
jgi:hypothetical protein